MNQHKLSIWLRLLAGFLLWTAGRAVWSLVASETKRNYATALQDAHGGTPGLGELLYAFLAIGGAVGIYYRWRYTFPVTLVALALFTASMLLGVMRMERNPAAARQAYAESRMARGLPMSEDKRDDVFSEQARVAMWAVAGLLCAGPLVILRWRRPELQGQNPED
jgi:hypothetical protein